MRSREMDVPIITSLLDLDFYKFTMGQVVFNEHPDAPVRYGLKCRTPGVRLAEQIDEGDLRWELDSVRDLRIDNTELHYLRGTNEYGERMFREDYLEFLKGLRLPPYGLSVKNGEYQLEFSGPWATTIYWETIALAIVNELYYRALMSRLSPFQQDVVYARGRTNLWEKLEILRAHPEIIFSDFGTRRRFMRWWHDYVTSVLKHELTPNQFRGTSNVWLAMRHGLLPMGTSAHELFMAMACIVPDTDEDIRRSPEKVLEIWERYYGEGLRIALPDTFGSQSFLNDIGLRLATWRGFRQDSGDPFQFGENVLYFYERFGVDARQKVLIFSDGLDIQIMLKLAEHFKDRIKVSFGWGTNLTNDLGFKALSLVIKLIEVNGRGTVKLSDNLAKAMGRPEDVARYKSIFGYTNTLTEACKY